MGVSYGHSFLELSHIYTDDKTHISEEPDFILSVLNDNVGYSRGNNIGVRIAHAYGCTHFVLANPDTELIDHDSVPRMVKLLMAIPKSVAVFPTVLAPDGTSSGNNQGPYTLDSRWKLLIGPTLWQPFSNMIRTVSNIAAKAWYRAHNAYPIHSSLGCFFVADTTRFLQLGGFDEQFFLYCEEAVLGQRAKNAGLKIFLQPHSTILHKHYYDIRPINMAIFHQAEARMLALYYGHTPRYLAMVAFRNKTVAALKWCYV